MTALLLLLGCVGRSAGVSNHPGGTVGTPVSRFAADSGDSTPDSADSAPDSTDTGDTGTVTLIYDSPDLTLSGIYGFGCDVASGGDIDGDGYDDLVVASDWSTEDKFWVYAGSAAGVLTESRYYSLGGGGAPDLTAAVSLVGDTNGDGYDDVVAAGAWFAGSATGLDTATGVGLVSGFSNSATGDVNGDGYDDVVIGSTVWTSPNDVGSVYVFDGGPDGMTEDAEYRGSNQKDHFGWAVAGGMDINGDGYSDVLGIGDDEVAVFYGAATGFAGGTASDGQDLGECYRCDANNAGDVDGDGFDEVLIRDGGYDPAQLTLQYGSPSGVDTARAWGYPVESPGYKGIGLGDFDSDGYADLFMNHDSDGSLGIFLGGLLGPGGTPILDVSGPGFISSLGAGDLDGDGVLDLIGGAPTSGEVYVFLGSTITDPSRASTDTGSGDSGRDTHSGGDTHTGSGSDSDPPADSAADSGTTDTSAARKTGCGSGGGCDAAGGAFDVAGLMVLVAALTRRRAPRT